MGSSSFLTELKNVRTSELNGPLYALHQVRVAVDPALDSSALLYIHHAASLDF